MVTVIPSLTVHRHTAKFSFSRQFAQYLEQIKSALTPFFSRVRHLEEEVELLTSYSSDTVYRLRYSDMQYDYISPAIIKLLGYSPEEMKRVNIRSLIIETNIIKDGIKTIHSFQPFENQRAKRQVMRWHADYLMETKWGNNIWVSDISYPWYNDQGKIIGAVGCLRDVTERVRAETQVREELVRLAHTDPLTLLANRRAFFSKVEEELKRVQRNRNDLSILIIDVDHFKKINDTYGHDVGDSILMELGQIIKSCLRETDMPARLGGEEFGAFLPDTPPKGAFWVAERIRMQIAKHVFFVNEVAGSLKIPVTCTVSIGIATDSGNEKLSAQELYKMADTRLYIAKNTGRNQVSNDEIVVLH